MKFPTLAVLATLALGAPLCGFAEVDEPPRTGYFKVEFSTRELLGEKGAVDAAEILHSDETIGWTIYVPDNYDAAAPAGVIIYVSPHAKGGPPGNWKGILRDKNLIWMGANNAGNRVAVGKRMFLAMLAPRVLVRNYVLDEERVYVAGFSGGGKTACRIAAAKPDIFRGGIYMGGAQMWGSNSPPPKLELIKQNRHVFITGANDFNEMLTRRVYAAYKSASVESSELVVVRRMGHELPDKKTLARAIDYLDSRN